MKRMTQLITTATAGLLLMSAQAAACTAEDVQARQDTLVAAVQQLMAVDPAKAQAIVVKMQADLDTAAAAGDDSAVCEIMDEALATATGG